MKKITMTVTTNDGKHLDYFNTNDEQIAAERVGRLQKFYPDAVVTREDGEYED
jgi:hypothetical protein